MSDATRPPFFHDHLDLMFENLSPDATQAGVIFAAHTRTGVGLDEVAELLERFARIDPLENHEADPRLVLRGPEARLSVRMQAGRLLICDLHTSTRAWSEAAIHEILALAQRRGKRLTEPAEPALPPMPGRTRWPVFMLLALGIGLNVYVIVRVLSFRPEPDFVPLGDGQPTEEIVQRIDGSFVTNTPASDVAYQRLVFSRPNFVTLQRYSEGAPRLKVTDLYLVGTYNGKPRLVTGQNGFIDAPDWSNLEFLGESYQRTKGAENGGK